MERLDQSSLLPSIEHPKWDKSRPGLCNFGTLPKSYLDSLQITSNHVVASWSPQALAIRKFKSRQGHHYGGTWPEFSQSSNKAPQTDMSRPGIEARPPEPQSYLDSEHTGHFWSATFYLFIFACSNFTFWTSVLVKVVLFWALLGVVCWNRVETAQPSSFLQLHLLLCFGRVLTTNEIHKLLHKF
jgi:hypothetical protein